MCTYTGVFEYFFLQSFSYFMAPVIWKNDGAIFTRVSQFYM